MGRRSAKKHHRPSTTTSSSQAGFTFVLGSRRIDLTIDAADRLASYLEDRSRRRAPNAYKVGFVIRNALEEPDLFPQEHWLQDMVGRDAVLSAIEQLRIEGLGSGLDDLHSAISAAVGNASLG